MAETIEINKFGGPLTRLNLGPLDSGLAKYDTSWGYDPFSNPTNLTWNEQPTSILTLTGTAGPVVAMKQRTEGNTNYVYAISKDGNLRKIQVNDTNNNIADFDSPSVIGALVNSTNVLRSATMTFYGSTQKIYYGDDSGIQNINFDGSGSTSILGTPSIVTAVPRAFANFLGKIYFTNGGNIGEIDSTETISNATKLSPGFPAGVVARDLDVTPDGNYLQITATGNNPQGGFTALTYTPGASTDSYKFLWNGSDTGYTSFESYNGFGFTSNAVFGSKNYALGYDPMGSAIYSGTDKLISLPHTGSPAPTATYSVGNMLSFMTPEFVKGVFNGSLFNYGKYDHDVPTGLFRVLRQAPMSKTDLEFIPVCINVSNLVNSPSYGNYQGSIASSGKMYFSTQETNGNSGQDVHNLWKFMTVPTGRGSIVAGTYETQSQLFPKKITVKQVRLYTEPLVTGNSFVIDLIGSNGSVLSGSSQIFTVGTNVTAGADRVLYNPASAPTYVLGARITNSSVLGTKNWVGNKLEIDIDAAGI